MLPRVREDRLEWQRRSGDVVAQDVLQLDRLCGRGDVVGRDRREDRVLVEDVVELPLQPLELLVRQAEPREIRDVLDVGARQGGHGPDDIRAVTSPRLRPMHPADLGPTVAAILADEWGDRRAWFAFAMDSPACRVFVAEDGDGAIAGTGVATINGPVGWVGTIWVAPAQRGRGLGRALTEATIDAADAAGCRTLVLVATDRGRPLYEGLGFEVQTWYRTMEAPGLVAEATDTSENGASRIRPFRTEDVAAIAALDRVATGEDRRSVITDLASPDGTRVLENDGSIGAFVIRAPWGGGATVAPRVEDALAILHGRRQAAGPGKRVRCGILAENAGGADALAADGWTEAWRAPRLIRGEPLDWHPDHIWGQFNHAMG